MVGAQASTAEITGLTKALHHALRRFFPARPTFLAWKSRYFSHFVTLRQSLQNRISGVAAGSRRIHGWFGLMMSVGLLLCFSIVTPAFADAIASTPSTVSAASDASGASDTPGASSASSTAAEPAEPAEPAEHSASAAPVFANGTTLQKFYLDHDALPPQFDLSSGPIVLHDVHLKHVLSLVLRRNRSVRGSRRTIDKADGKVLQARSVLGAKLSGVFSQTRVDDVGKSTVGGQTVAMGKRDSQVAYLELTQPLFLSGKDRAALLSSRLGRSMAAAGHTLTKQTILLQTTMTWLSWLFAMEAEKVGLKDLELAETHQTLVSARFRQKQVSQFEVLRADVRLAQARSEHRKLCNSTEQAYLNLLDILDLPTDTVLETSDRLLMVELSIDPVKDTTAAIELREDLRLKRLEVELNKQGIKSARSENKPVISVFGQSGVQDPSSKSSMGNYDRQSYWKAGVTANFTLADGGSRKGQIREAGAALAIAQNALEEALFDVGIEIRQAYLNIETAKEVVAAQEKALVQAEEALRLADVRYRNGLFTQVELFDVENAYLATRLRYLQAIFSCHQAYVSYRLATGQLGRDLIAQIVEK